MLGNWLDDYERTARLLPGLLALAPLVVAASALLGPIRAWQAGVGGAVVALLGPVVLAGYVRGRGVALESRLFAAWGGPPTALLLRPAAGTNPVRAQRRAAVERVTGVSLPTTLSEDQDSEEAEVYRAATLRCAVGPATGTVSGPSTPRT